MYRIIIVDDEVLARIGLKSMIPWDSIGCELLGEACNGEEGLKLFQETQPDIVITDIKMPVMDGLEMIRQLKKKHPKTKFIVLSSYDEFHLVKEAMKLGAEEYLIKLDVSPEILIKTIKTVCDKLLEEAEEDRKKSILDMRARINMDSARKDFLKKLMNKTVISWKDIKDNLIHLGIKVLDGSFITLLIEVNEIVDKEKFLKEDDIALLDFCVENVAGEVANDFFPSYTFKYSDNLFVILCSIANTGSCDHSERLEKLGMRLISTLNNYANVHVSVGISNVHSQAANLNQAFKESLFAVEASFSQGIGKVLHYIEVPQLETSQKEVNISRQLVELKDAFDYMDYSRITEVMNSIANVFKSSHISKIQAHEVCGHIAYKLKEIAENSTSVPVIEFIDINNLFKDISELNTIDKIVDWLNNIRNKLIEVIRSYLDQNQNAILVQRAKKYISENISKEIMLSDISSFLNISHCYFSTVFKQHTGENFTDYVARVKISEAQKLLKKGRYKIYEVAEMMGYENAYYFSRVFKKVTGSTPKEYMDNAV